MQPSKSQKPTPDRAADRATGLAAVLAGLDESTIRDCAAARKVLHVPGGCGVPPESLLTLADLERLVAQGTIRPQQLRVWMRGVSFDHAKSGLFDSHGRIKPRTLANLTRQGASFIVNDVHRLIPALWDLACEAESALVAAVAFETVVSFGNTPALTPHFDSGDMIIIQLAGSKNWRMLGEPFEGPTRLDKREIPRDVTSIATMQPGDLLYIPAGQSHHCDANDGFSLHLCIHLTHASGREALNALVDQHLDLIPTFQPFLGADVLAEQEARFKAALIARLEAFDISAWAIKRIAAKASIPTIDLRGAESDVRNG